MKGLLRLWFGLERPVLRRDYVLSGVGLMGLKYAVDTAVFRFASGNWLTPWQYVSPFLATRWDTGEGVQQPFLWLLVLWALPFAWIGVAMSMRRAASAGLSPWLALLFFVPGVNYVLMLGLALIPDRAPEAWGHRRRPPEAKREGQRDRLTAALLGVAIGAAISVALVAVGLVLTPVYGYSLFLGMPFIIGATSSYSFNRGRARAVGESIAVAMIAVVMAMGFALIFGYEGAICLVMAAPIGIVGAIVGGALGRSIALAGYRSATAIWLLVATLPLLGWAEGEVGRRRSKPVFEVTTRISVEASPMAVWDSLIDFPPLEAAEARIFRVGIAYPIGASIDGKGVGAVRRCEFSTGAFVEPVTVWRPGRRLAFDVLESPPAMAEWSPHGALLTGHLDSGFQAIRGEFQLRPLAGGRTLLEGTTWYRLEILPELYWKLWADWIVHSIHDRVLEHVSKVAEAV